MAKKIIKKKKVEAENTEAPAAPQVNPEKERLLGLYATLQELRITRIADLENLIARA